MFCLDRVLHHDVVKAILSLPKLLNGYLETDCEFLSKRGQFHFLFKVCIRAVPHFVHLSWKEVLLSIKHS